MQEATATPPQRARLERWSPEQLSALICNAGRVSVAELCRLTGCDEGEVREVAARVRATGYPISLTVETCPMCGRRAPLTRNDGICEVCRQRRVLDGTRARMARMMPRLSARERELYASTEAQVGKTRRNEPRPSPPAIPPDATEAKRADALDAYDAELAAWAGRIAAREAKAAQKRLERMAYKAQRAGADVSGAVAAKGAP